MTLKTEEKWLLKIHLITGINYILIYYQLFLLYCLSNQCSLTENKRLKNIGKNIPPPNIQKFEWQCVYKHFNLKAQTSPPCPTFKGVYFANKIYRLSILSHILNQEVIWQHGLFQLLLHMVKKYWPVLTLPQEGVVINLHADWSSLENL